MRRLRWLILLPVILATILFAIANRADVVISFNPLDPANLEYGLQLPLYGVVLIAIFIGILVGGAVVWMKQRKWRRMAKAASQLGGQTLGITATTRHSSAA